MSSWFFGQHPVWGKSAPKPDPTQTNCMVCGEFGANIAYPWMGKTTDFEFKTRIVAIWASSLIFPYIGGRMVKQMISFFLKKNMDNRVIVIFWSAPRLGEICTQAWPDTDKVHGLWWVWRKNSLPLDGENHWFWVQNANRRDLSLKFDFSLHWG